MVPPRAPSFGCRRAAAERGRNESALAAGALGALLDRHVDEVAPLRPRAVVVADVLVAEELAQDEPRVGASLADPAVGRDRLPRGDALPLVELAKLVGGLEGPVVPNRLRPR